MEIFKTPQEAVKYIKEINITQSRDKYINDILDKGICRIGSEIIIVDEYELLKD